MKKTMRINESIVKVKAPHESAAPQIYPYNILALLPPVDCVFDSFHGTVGFDVYPFAVTTRINSSNQIFLTVTFCLVGLS